MGFFKDIFKLIKLFFNFLQLTFFSVVNLKGLFLSIKEYKSDDSIIQKEKESFIELKKTLNKETLIEWRRFIVTCLSIQAILCFFMIINILYGNLFLIFQTSFMFLSSIILFGYRPWIVYTQRYGSFFSYIKDIPHNANVLWLWPFYKKLDNICQ